MPVCSVLPLYGLWIWYCVANGFVVLLHVCTYFQRVSDSKAAGDTGVVSRTLPRRVAKKPDRVSTSGTFHGWHYFSLSTVQHFWIWLKFSCCCWCCWWSRCCWCWCRCLRHKCCFGIFLLLGSCLFHMVTSSSLFAPQLYKPKPTNMKWSEVDNSSIDLLLMEISLSLSIMCMQPSVPLMPPCNGECGFS